MFTRVKLFICVATTSLLFGFSGAGNCYSGFEPTIYDLYWDDNFLSQVSWTDGPNVPLTGKFSTLGELVASWKAWCEQEYWYPIGTFVGPTEVAPTWLWKVYCMDNRPGWPNHQLGRGILRRSAVCGAWTNKPPPSSALSMISVTIPESTRVGFTQCALSDANPRKNVGCCERASQKSAGNPINVSYPNKFEQQVDIIASGSSRLRMDRSYNSAYYTASRGQWSWTYDTRLRLGGFNSDLVSVERPDGRAHSFNLVSGVWTPDADVSHRLTEILDGGGHRIGWQYRIADDDSFESYDTSGNLTGIQYRDGSTVSLTYSDASTPPNVAPVPGLLIGVADQYGRMLSFAYDTGSRRIGMTDPRGGQYIYGYGTAGDLSTVQYPGGSDRTYLYNESAYTSGYNLPHILTGITDELGQRFATFTYSPSGNPISTEHAGGVNKFLVSYVGSQSKVTDPLGTQRTYTFATALGTVRTISTDQPCQGCGVTGSAFTYDANGNVSSRTDFNSKKVCSAYDLTRNLETARAEGILSTETCSTVLATLPSRADVRKVSTQWHAIWRLPAKVAEPNRITTNTYNGDGGVFCAPTTALVNGSPIGVLCKKTVQETTDTTGQQGLGATVTGTPRAWQYTYDAFGQVLTATDPNGKVTTTVYYSATDPDPGKRGNVQTVTNAVGHVTTITAYDGNGRPLSITDPNGAVTTLTYWPRGWLHTRTVAGETTTYDYDGVGQLTKVTQPDGSFVQYTYDGAHRLTQIQDGLNNKIIYTLDAMGNRIKEQAYDPSGTLARVRQQVYDSLNRLHQSVGAQ